MYYVSVVEPQAGVSTTNKMPTSQRTRRVEKNADELASVGKNTEHPHARSVVGYRHHHRSTRLELVTKTHASRVDCQCTFFTQFVDCQCIWYTFVSKISMNLEQISLGREAFALWWSRTRACYVVVTFQNGPIKARMT